MAYDNLVLPISVTQAMQAAGLYLTTGTIPEATLSLVGPTGAERDYNMGRIDYNDLKTFADELDIALRLQNPIMQYLFAKNAVQISELIRVIQYTTRSGFKGSCGSGNALDALLFRAEQFQNPDVDANTARTSWARSVPSLHVAPPVTGNFIESGWTAAGAAHGVALAAAANEGLAVLGFANPAADPCVSGVQFTYLGTPYNVQNLSFELSNAFYGDPIIELKQPLIIYPSESALIQVYYYKNGTDELRPIGLWIKMASNIRNLVTA